MIKNLPNDITKASLNELLSDIGNINYLYLPHDKYSNKCLRFAFVNVVNYKTIIQLYNKLNGIRLEDFEMKRSLEIFYSKVQGKLGLSLMFGRKWLYDYVIICFISVLLYASFNFEIINTITPILLINEL